MTNEVLSTRCTSFFPDRWEICGTPESSSLNATTSSHIPPDETSNSVENVAKSYFHLVGQSACDKTSPELVKSIKDSSKGHGKEKVDLSQMKGTINGSLVEDVTLKSGTVVYSSSSHATKASLLAPIEETLKRCIILAIQSGEHWDTEYAWFLKTMPKTIPELIQFMYDERVLSLSQKDVEILQRAYKVGEFHYKAVLSIYSTTNKRVEITLSPDDAQELKDMYSQAHTILLKLLDPSKDAKVHSD